MFISECFLQSFTTFYNFLASFVAFRKNLVLKLEFQFPCFKRPPRPRGPGAVCPSLPPSRRPCSFSKHLFHRGLFVLGFTNSLERGPTVNFPVSILRPVNSPGFAGRLQILLAFSRSPGFFMIFSLFFLVFQQRFSYNKNNSNDFLLDKIFC